ncbi:hypothetical protein ETI06_02950 [Macrococcoides goetzii]|nr:hypothetical protein [Macrococcus goetzii]TDM50956.1 hypothetical protein ETI06_02950 [Macrococcus goetzii]
MPIQYRLEPVDKEVIQKTSQEELLKNIPNDYWTLFEDGNFIVYKDWNFYPIRDNKNIKKTATDILTMNKRNQSDHTVIAENTAVTEGFLGFSKNEEVEGLYVWSEWPEIEPIKIFNNINELITILKNYSRFNDNDFDKMLDLIKTKAMFYYIMDNEIGNVMGEMSFDYFPAYSYYFWTEEKIPQTLANKKSHFSVEIIDKEIFMNDVLNDIDMEENSILINPMSNESIEFYPHEVLEEIEE